MNVIDCHDYESLSALATSFVISELEKQRNLLLCAATGRSPVGLYERLVTRSRTDRALFAELRVVKLDEWVGMPADDPGSCEHYLRERVVDPLAISPDRYTAFASTPDDPARECERIQRELDRIGPIDVCVLGLGANGHLGFNEPGPLLPPRCHVAQLSDETRRHSMVRSQTTKPQLGLTLGMREILSARRIILLVAGAGKEKALAGLLAQQVTTSLPASFLWLHDHTDCLIDRSA